MRPNHRDDVIRSVVKNMMIYALGRPFDVTDDEAIAKISAHLAKNNYRARELVRAVIFSQPFLQK